VSDELNKDIDNATNSLSKMERILQQLITTATKFSSTLSGGLKNTGLSNNGGIGQTGIGSSGNNVMGNSFGNMPAMLSMNRTMNMNAAMMRGGISALTGVVAGGFAAMPDVASTTARSMGFYGAGLMGGSNRTQMMSATMGFMNGGITSQGGVAIGDVQTANAFARAGIGPNVRGVNAGQFGSLATSVANAAKYLNVDNGQAAQSMAALTQGGMSSNLMRNFGIYTTDPRTGRRLSPSEIYGAVANRITGGQKLSTQDLMTSMQGGALGVDLAQIGDQTTQDMVYQTLLANASDSKTKAGMNLASKASMAAFGHAAGVNPGASQLTANSLQAGTMNAASDAYIKGMQDAVGVLKQFHGVMNAFLKGPGRGLAQLNSGANMLAGDNVTGGALTAIGGIGGGLGGVGGMMLQNAMLSRTLRKAGVEGGAAPRSRMGLGKKVGLAAVGNLAGEAISSGSKQGSFQSKLGSAISWGTNGAMLGSFLGPEGTAAGAIIGGLAGGLYGMFSGGDNSKNGMSPMTDTTGGIKLIHPVGRAKVTCRYGQKDSLHSSGHHGVDFGVAEGTSVQAAADGTVVYAGGSSANTMGTNDFSLGIQLEIKHANGYSTVYGHLSSYGVSIGDTVSSSQVIAKSGNTGYSSGPHLHFELRKDGNPIDPSSALGANYAAASGTYTDASSSSGSASSSGSLGGSGDTTGFSSGAMSAAGISIPPSWSGSGSGISASTQSSKSGGGMIGHGASSTTTGGASVGSPSGGGTPASNNNVVINVSVAQASEAEAKRFANMIKQYIDDDRLTANMGSM
jgi:murein DD-endopeptidase MepM/ murein hydrolase activator NlpD